MTIKQNNLIEKVENLKSIMLTDEDRPARSQGVDHVAVVHDLLAHVDRGAVELERLLDGDDGAVDARAVSARGGKEDPLRVGAGHGPIVRGTLGP